MRIHGVSRTTENEARVTTTPIEQLIELKIRGFDKWKVAREFLCVLAVLCVFARKSTLSRSRKIANIAKTPSEPVKEIVIEFKSHLESNADRDLCLRCSQPLACCSNSRARLTLGQWIIDTTHEPVSSRSTIVLRHQVRATASSFRIDPIGCGG
jgi:hypothetical protein